jgi:mxaD protein
MRTFLTRVVWVLLAVCCGWAPAGFAAGKVKVVETVELNAPASKVWDTVKDFDKWQTWHPAVASTDIPSGGNNKRGMKRVLHLNGGGDVAETLTAWSNSAKRQTYVITASPLPVDQYTSTMIVTARKGGSKITWSSTFVPKGASAADAKKTISGVYTAGFDNLKKMFP